MVRQIRRLDPDIKEIAAEIENYRHYASGKSPHGLCVESSLYLFMGATQLSYAIICSASEPMEWYADNYFKKLREWRPFYEEYARFNEGTEPGGLDPYISPNQVIRKKRPGETSFGWITTAANDPLLSLSFLGIPFCPDGNNPSSLIMDTEAVNGLTMEEATYLFQHRGILLDTPAWERARTFGVDNKGKLRSVTLLNCSISEQPETQLRLCGCDLNKNQKFVWKKAEQPDVILHPQYDGNDVIIQIPRLEGWNIGWLAITSLNSVPTF